jgi:hypothetical protein
LGNKIKIVAGGRDTPESLPGVLKMEDFTKFNDWLGDFESTLNVT